MALDYSLHPGKAWHELVAAPLSEARERERAKKEARRKSLEATLERYQRAKSRFYETLVRGIVCMCFVCGGGWCGAIWVSACTHHHHHDPHHCHPTDRPTAFTTSPSLSLSLFHENHQDLLEETKHTTVKVAKQVGTAVQQAPQTAQEVVESVQRTTDKVAKVGMKVSWQCQLAVCQCQWSEVVLSGVGVGGWGEMGCGVCPVHPST